MMQEAVIVRCPKCEIERIISPRYGEIIAVYCLCPGQDPEAARYPTRMEFLPTGDREPVAV